MPAMGLGTFGYGQPNGNDGEHWNNSNVQEVSGDEWGQTPRGSVTIPR